MIRCLSCLTICWLLLHMAALRLCLPIKHTWLWIGESMVQWCMMGYEKEARCWRGKHRSKIRTVDLEHQTFSLISSSLHLSLIVNSSTTPNRTLTRTQKQLENVADALLSRRSPQRVPCCDWRPLLRLDRPPANVGTHVLFKKMPSSVQSKYERKFWEGKRLKTSNDMCVWGDACIR